MKRRLRSLPTGDAVTGHRLLGPADYPPLPDLFTADPDGFAGRHWILDPDGPAIYIRGDLTPAQGRQAWAAAFTAYATGFDRPALRPVGGVR